MARRVSVSAVTSSGDVEKEKAFRKNLRGSQSRASLAKVVEARRLAGFEYGRYAKSERFEGSALFDGVDERKSENSSAVSSLVSTAMQIALLQLLGESQDSAKRAKFHNATHGASKLENDSRYRKALSVNFGDGSPKQTAGDLLRTVDFSVTPRMVESGLVLVDEKNAEAVLKLNWFTKFANHRPFLSEPKPAYSEVGISENDLLFANIMLNNGLKALFAKGLLSARSVTTNPDLASNVSSLRFDAATKDSLWLLAYGPSSVFSSKKAVELAAILVAAKIGCFGEPAIRESVNRVVWFNCATGKSRFIDVSKMTEQEAGSIAREILNAPDERVVDMFSSFCFGVEVEEDEARDDNPAPTDDEASKEESCEEQTRSRCLLRMKDVSESDEGKPKKKKRRRRALVRNETPSDLARFIGKNKCSFKNADIMKSGDVFLSTFVSDIVQPRGGLVSESAFEILNATDFGLLDFDSKNDAAFDLLPTSIKGSVTTTASLDAFIKSSSKNGTPSVSLCEEFIKSAFELDEKKLVPKKFGVASDSFCTCVEDSLAYVLSSNAATVKRFEKLRLLNHIVFLMPRFFDSETGCCYKELNCKSAKYSKKALASISAEFAERFMSMLDFFGGVESFNFTFSYDVNKSVSLKAVSRFLTKESVCQVSFSKNKFDCNSMLSTVLRQGIYANAFPGKSVSASILRPRERTAIVFNDEKLASDILQWSTAAV